MNTIKLLPVIWKCIIENKRDGTGLFSHSRETSLEFPQIVDELSNYYRDLDNYMSKMDYKTGSISLLRKYNALHVNEIFPTKEGF